MLNQIRISTIGRYLSVFAFIMLSSSGCKKEINTTPSNTPFLTANCNNTAVVFTGSVKVSSSEYTINGTSSTNSVIQIEFYATSPGDYKLGFEQAMFTSPSGESWQTNLSDTGSVIISAITSSSITGTFSFTGLETKPTPGGSALVVNSGNFYLTW